MSCKKIAQYGTWAGPVSAEVLAGQFVIFNEVHVNVSPVKSELSLSSAKTLHTDRH